MFDPREIQEEIDRARDRGVPDSIIPSELRKDPRFAVYTEGEISAFLFVRVPESARPAIGSWHKALVAGVSVSAVSGMVVAAVGGGPSLDNFSQLIDYWLIPGAWFMGHAWLIPPILRFERAAYRNVALLGLGLLGGLMGWPNPLGDSYGTAFLMAGLLVGNAGIALIIQYRAFPDVRDRLDGIIRR